jgi:hypothetical protein
MKRFWLVMLSLGLVLAFSASAMAVDVKFSGSYYAGGLYLDKTTLNKSSYTNISSVAAAVPTLSTVTSTVNSGNSTAFYYQRLRAQTEFIVSPGLKLTTRFDALERIWGGARSAATTNDSAGTKTENENIAFDQAYIDYVSPIGFFRIGYQPDSGWGTVFGDSEINGAPVAKLLYAIPVGPVTFSAGMIKVNDKSNSYALTTTATDRDYEKYSLTASYKAKKDLEGGLAFEYRRIALNKDAPSVDSPLIPLYSAFVQNYALNPYAKAKFGPVAIEAEAVYAWGQLDWENNLVGVNTVKLENVSGYLNIMADFKMVYGGLTFAYASGDDPGSTDKLEGGLATGGKDFNPTLIMFNSDLTYWVGALPGYNYTPNVPGQSPWLQSAGAALGQSTISTSTSNEMTNAWFFQGMVGVRPLAALDIKASVSYANADKKPAGVVNNSIGWEVDLSGTYKITNNLSYMLGAGYFITGDYFQGSNDQADLNNTYILVNKLTLTF